ncbi:hypothetical protein ACHAXR_010685, partial [Thalassiosira sp. AJA248-18]
KYLEPRAARGYLSDPRAPARRSDLRQRTRPNSNSNSPICLLSPLSTLQTEQHTCYHRWLAVHCSKEECRPRVKSFLNMFALCWVVWRQISCSQVWTVDSCRFISLKCFASATHDRVLPLSTKTNCSTGKGCSNSCQQRHFRELKSNTMGCHDGQLHRMGVSEDACCCYLAFTYSYLIQNQFMFWANAPGLIISVWLNLAAAKLQYCDRISTDMRSSFVELLDSNRRSFAMRGTDEHRVLGGDLDKEEESQEDENPSTVQTFANLRKMALAVTIQKTEAPAPHEKVVVGVVTIWVAVISLLSFLKLSTDQWKWVVGIVVNINLSFFYGAPLSTIFTVLKTRDSSSIHRWTMLMNTANGCFWTAFGFGILDWLIIVPNGLGALLGFTQMFIRLIIPSREVFPSSREIERQGVELPAGVLDAARKVGVDIEATATASTGEA